MIDEITYITEETRKYLEKTIQTQIAEIANEIENPENFKKKNIMDKISVVKEGDANGNE